MTGKADPDVMRRLKENYAPFYAATKPGLLTERFYRDNCYYYRAEVLPLLPENRNARILEVGCGAGHLIRFLAERGYGRVGGVELDRGLCEMARNNVGDKAEFIEHGDALAFLASRRDRFDAVIALDVSRALRARGGRLLLEVRLRLSDRRRCIHTADSEPGEPPWTLRALR